MASGRAGLFGDRRPPVLFAEPQSAIVGIVALLAGLVSLLPLVVDSATAVFERLDNVGGSAGAIIAVHELRSPKTRVRSATIAAISAIAVFASVTIQGSHLNLQGGLDPARIALSDGARQCVGTAVRPAGSARHDTADRPTTSAHLLRIFAESAAPSSYRASFLTYDARRAWVLAPPSTALRLDPVEPDGHRGSRACEHKVASRWLGCAFAGTRGSASSAHWRECHVACSSPNRRPCRGAEHKSRMAAGRDHSQLRELRPRVGQLRNQRIQRHAGTESLRRSRRS